MQTYLILYGAQNELATFEAEDVAHAVEQFCDWAPVAPDYQANRDAIAQVMVCTPVEF